MNNKIYGLAMFALVANPSECKGRINKTPDALDLASFSVEIMLPKQKCLQEKRIFTMKLGICELLLLTTVNVTHYLFHCYYTNTN